MSIFLRGTLPLPSPYLYRKTLKIGLLGGSYNPPHAGHVFICKTAMKQYRLDRIWWLISPSYPHKASLSLLPYDERVRLCQDVLRHVPRFDLVDIEGRAKISYSIDTIKLLKCIYPKVQFYWIMGADNLQTFHHWHRWRQLIKMIPFIVVDRGEDKYPALHSPAAALERKERYRERTSISECKKVKRHNPLFFLFVRKHPASATEIRKNWKKQG